jgi:hypothetical protein
MSMDYHATDAAGDRKADMLRRVVVLAGLALGCSSPLTEARTSFDEARYPDAVAEYRALRPRLPTLTRPQLFEYALYRGLSHLALGDARPAEHWLVIAKRLSEQSPGLVTAEQEGRLMSAWRSMGHMPGD